jgi:hypothetical protein
VEYPTAWLWLPRRGILKRLGWSALVFALCTGGAPAQQARLSAETRQLNLASGDTVWTTLRDTYWDSLTAKGRATCTVE